MLHGRYNHELLTFKITRIMAIEQADRTHCEHREHLDCNIGEEIQTNNEFAFTYERAIFYIYHFKLAC